MVLLGLHPHFGGGTGGNMSVTPVTGAEKVTVPGILGRKSLPENSRRRITCLTAYDFPTARLLDDAGVDILLVGDSLGMVVLGYDNTLPVTTEEMLHHLRAVRRGTRRALLVADMPFGSYQASVEEAVRNASLLIKEGAQAVKLEGGAPMAATIRRLTDVGIPVMAHNGLTPQSIHALGGFRVQGRTESAAARLLRDARAVEHAGAFSVVLESVPRELAAELTRELQIPTIGIGAGPDCDGQVLVFHDLVGLAPCASPKFARRYADLAGEISRAAAEFCEDVRNGRFPSDAESYHLPSELRERRTAAKKL
jgi:3-methyl-2-oxobutanoate hydroxymethyltransferase